MLFRYFIANKPYNVICQFTAESEGQITLAGLNFDFPKDVYPIGRLDLDSEGLLLLTSDRSLSHRLLNPQFAHERTYLTQVEGIVSEKTLLEMQVGLDIKLEKKIYRTLPCRVEVVDDPSVFFNKMPVWERTPAAKSSGNKPMSWLAITLIEGKNRQVRRMCAKIHHPCLRLIRVKIADLAIGNLAINEVLELTKEEVYSKLKM